MIDDIKEDLYNHAKEEYPRECCGVVVVFKGRNRYVPCRNISEYLGDFDIHPEDLINAEAMGEIVAICHSHPNARPEPSDADKTSCEIHGVPWIIIGYPTGEIKQIEPCGFKAPLVGRKFVHGVHDCYELARDYYKEILDIDLPVMHRHPKGWELDHDIMNSLNFDKTGFEVIPLSDLQEHDIIIMQNQATVPNHIGVYLGNNVMLHQCIGRLSSKDSYGGYWLKNTKYALRHKALAKNI